MKRVAIVAAKRTPMGSFGGSLKSISAPQLGAAAIKGAMESIGLDPASVEEVFMGNVLQANVGQAPARQASIFAGIPDSVPCTTINKVCASGMKAVMLGAQSIACGDADVVVAGGMESMTNAPYYLPGGRYGHRFGDSSIVDGLVKDGLTDVYGNTVMGVCAETCASGMSFSREEQDAFAMESYKRSAEANASGKFKDEIVPVEIPQRKGEPLLFSEDEEFKNFNPEKFVKLRTVFKKEGTITAGNASTINDGASALVLMSEEKANALGMEILGFIRGYADAAHEPEWFTTAPAKAVPKALAKAGLNTADIDFWELNEAFAVVGLANMKLLEIDSSIVNVNGGAVSLGHPLGNSGSRILVTLLHVLKQKGGKLGAAGICNGGGGASALIIENV